MKPEDVLESLRPWREKHRRLAWKPLVALEDGPATSSKFGGLPWLPAGTEWPVCPACEDPLAFFLQIDLNETPDGSPAKQPGLLQLFYCTNDEADCESERDGWSAFSDVSVVRIVHPAQGGRPAAETPEEVESAPRRITSWAPFEDLPHPSEHERLGLTYAYDFKDRTVTVGCADLGLTFPDLPLDGIEWAETIAQSSAGDKLGGWPYWVQNVEYPACPRCQTVMDRVLFQVESEENVPFMFGDSGVGHVTQCPRHADVVAFAWACC